MWKRIGENINSILDYLNEELPVNLKDFFYALGGTPFFLFFLQVFTGVFLFLYYIPSSDSAYESVYRITFSIPMGWWVRGLHRYGASLFILSLFLHATRTFITGAYRSPRELIWIIGGFMLLISLSMGFTGYALVNDQLSYWATSVGTNIAASIPLFGKIISFIIKGGERITQFTLSRLFVAHVFVLPLFLLLFIGLHIVLVRMKGLSLSSEEKYPLIPGHLYLEMQVFLFCLTLLNLLVALFPPDLGEKANPFVTPSHIKPEWYFYPLYLLLKVLPLKAGILACGFFILLFLFLPYVERSVEKVPGWRWSLFIRAGGILVVLYIAGAIIKEALD